MVALIAGLIGYLSYCIVAFLTKIVVMIAYAVGAVLYFILKHGIKLVGYCAKFLSLVVYWMCKQLYLYYLKERVKAADTAFYAESKKIDL